ncbi:MAG: type II toxin-antitoxin system VapC family toxin [Candidatus Omnitrophica bacterium]|nr:type II toxin-antitoxin system VapC family toxin [Candidatus Omnitrophota bacterium]
MRAFIDTSALLKKYIHEQGSDKFDQILKNISEIAVAPTLLLEVRCSVQRRVHDGIIDLEQAEFIKQEIKKDCVYFIRVSWDDALEQAALTIIEKYKLKTLDSIQLASAHLSKADTFVTSDQKLFHVAKKELKNAVLI